MNCIEPSNQTKIFGLGSYLAELIELEKKDILPNKILLSGSKGLGKSTLAYHFINYVLSKNEKFNYDINNFIINTKSNTFKTIQNKSNPNFILIDLNFEKKLIDINQIRNLISNLRKSSFNDKPRFVLIDNIEFLNVNSVNALLKILEEPSYNVYFILINNNKKVLSTLLSRCINFKIFLSNKQSKKIANELLDDNLDKIVNKDLINYYITPGNIFRLVTFANLNNYDLMNLDLKDFLKIIIKDNLYKKDNFISYFIFDFIEFYFRKINLSFSSLLYNEYTYFLNQISNTKKFNLDNESLFIEFEEKILNG